MFILEIFAELKKQTYTKSMNHQIKMRTTLENNKFYFESIQEYGIDYCYAQNIECETDVLIIPDACIDLLFYCDEQHPQITYYGPLSKPQTHDLKKGYYFGVHFLPGEVPQILNNQSISIQKLLNHRLIIYGKEIKEQINAMEEMILHTDIFKLQVALFKSYYVSIYTMEKKEDKKKKCVDSILQKIIQSNGAIRSNELSNQFAYSEQYLNRIFKNQTGLTPKNYSNLVRFQNALTLLVNDPQMNDLSELSIQSGYYDQSHMIKEFKKYTNQTPQAFLKTLKNA